MIGGMRVEGVRISRKPAALSAAKLDDALNQVVELIRAAKP